MQQKKSLSWLGVITGILFLLFLISLGLIVTINFRGLYYSDITHLNIVEESGYDVATIRENYDALIDYCSPFYKGDLVFPSLPASREGLIHFAEVKDIFVGFYYILGFSFLGSILFIFYYYKKKNYHFLLTTSLTTILLPLLVGGACSINFNRTFILFHKLFFRNDYWLFDPETDPIINLLPEEFFLHCALMIVGIVLLGCFIQLDIYFYCKHKSKHR